MGKDDREIESFGAAGVRQLTCTYTGGIEAAAAATQEVEGKAHTVSVGPYVGCIGPLKLAPHTNFTCLLVKHMAQYEESPIGQLTLVVVFGGHKSATKAACEPQAESQASWPSLLSFFPDTLL